MQKHRVRRTLTASWERGIAGVEILLAFVYSPEKWAATHGAPWVEAQRVWGFAIQLLYLLARVPMMTTDGQETVFEPRRSALPTSPWVRHLIRREQQLPGYRGDVDLIGELDLMAEGKGDLSEVFVGRFTARRQFVYAYLFDSPLRSVVEQLKHADHRTWKVCPLCLRPFPAVRKTKTCPVCRLHLTRRQIQRRLLEAPRDPKRLVALLLAVPAARATYKFVQASLPPDNG